MLGAVGMQGTRALSLERGTLSHGTSYLLGLSFLIYKMETVAVHYRVAATVQWLRVENTVRIAPRKVGMIRVFTLPLR